MASLIGKNILVMDIETTSLNVDEAKITWFGVYSYLDDKYYIIPFQGNEKDVKELIKRHKIIVGFNQKEFDNPILKNNFNDEELFDYKVQIDLLEISAPKGGKNFGQFRKNRLVQMGIKLKNFTLKNIIEKLKLDDSGTKGDIDYRIFQKTTWTSDEIIEIKKYLKQDVELTKKLFEWYDEQFSPLKKFLPQKDQDNFLYLKTSLSVLAYNIICNKAGLPVEFGDKDPNRKSYSGGHHLEQRWDLVRGNIIEVDFCCLLKDEYVYTDKGYKKVQDLKIGDKSLSLDNKLNEINHIKKEKSNAIIEFYLSNGDVLKVTPNHKIPIFKGKKKNKSINIKAELVNAEKIVIGDNFISPVVNHNLSVGKQEDIFELLGIFLCEGTQDRIERFLIDKKHPKGRKSIASRTIIGIKNHEIDFKKRITELIKKHCPYDFKWITLKKKSKDREYTNQSISNTTKEFYFWFDDLIKNNFNLFDITKNESRIKSFLSGVFKSDATFNIIRKEFVLQNHNKKLMMIIRRCLDILGIYYNTYQSKNPTGNSVNLTNSISIAYGSELYKLFSWFKFNSYRDKRIKHKNSVYGKDKKIVKVINIIKRKGDYDVYNISMKRQDSPYYIHNGYYTKNSAYPHAIMMGNLHSNVNKDNDGWIGDGYYHIEGRYDNKNQGKVELALKDVFLERLKAKKLGDKAKNLSYKIVINSSYGLMGNPIFKSLYNRNTASNCTSMVRTWMKKLAKKLEISGFICLYGFTDSIYVLIPPPLTKEDLMFVVKMFIEEAKSHVPFPMDTFQMDTEEEIKMIWFVAKNCYLFVTQDNKVKYKSTLLNTNTPEVVMKLFKEYIEPIIIKTLDIPFTKNELENKLKELLEKTPNLAGQEYKVSELNDYKVNTSLQYQISKKYGVGRHFLIPNKKGIGIGREKSNKIKRGLRYCTIEEFKQNNLKINDIDLKHLLSHLKPFYEKNEKKNENKSKQLSIQ